jgi:hypothetical protein
MVAGAFRRDSTRLVGGTVHAPCTRRRYCKTPDIDLFTANETDAVVSSVNPAQSAFHLGQLFAAPTARLYRHLLRLHRIHARQPADTGLIQRHRLRRCFRCRIQRAKFRSEIDQLALEFFQICVVHCSNDTKPKTKLQADRKAVTRDTTSARDITDKPDPCDATSQLHAGPADHGVSSE